MNWSWSLLLALCVPASASVAFTDEIDQQMDKTKSPLSMMNPAVTACLHLLIRFPDRTTDLSPCLLPSVRAPGALTSILGHLELLALGSETRTVWLARTRG